MSPRRGQMSNPNEMSTRIRLSTNDNELLISCVIKTGQTRSQIIRNGIKEIYRKEVGSMSELTMHTKYEGDVPVDKSATVSIRRDIVTNEISAYFVCMNDRDFEVQKNVFDAVVKKFNIRTDALD